MLYVCFVWLYSWIYSDCISALLLGVTCNVKSCCV